MSFVWVEHFESDVCFQNIGKRSKNNPEVVGVVRSIYF